MKTLIFLLLTCLAGSANAQTAQGNEYLIHAHGVVMAPPCHINNDTTVDINFGSVGYKSIKTGAASVTTYIPVSCDDKQASYLIRITGAALTDEKNAIETSINGLGIRFSNYGYNILLNEFFAPVSYFGDRIDLTSRLLITEEFDRASEGLFTAHATMTAQYD